MILKKIPEYFWRIVRSVKNLRYVGYYFERNLRIEIIGSHIYTVKKPVVTQLLTSWNLDVLEEISLTFEPGYPVVDTNEYSSNYDQLREKAKHPTVLPTCNGKWE